MLLDYSYFNISFSVCFKFLIRYVTFFILEVCKLLQVFFIVLFISQLSESLFSILWPYRHFLLKLFSLFFIIYSSYGKDFKYNFVAHYEIIALLLEIFPLQVLKLFICYLFYFSIFIFLMSKATRKFLPNWIWRKAKVIRPILPDFTDWYYVNVINVSPRFKIVLGYFDVHNSAIVKLSEEEYADLRISFKGLYLDNRVRVEKVLFFNYLFGVILFDKVCRSHGKDLVDKDVFISLVNSFILNIFSEKASKGLYFCDGVVLNVSLMFWLDNLLKKDLFINRVCISPYISFFIDSSGIFSQFNMGSLIDKSVLYKDLQNVKSLSLLDDKLVEDYISVNSSSLCSKFSITSSDWISLNNSHSIKLGFSSFRKNCISF